jgi:hypothetical protein
MRSEQGETRRTKSGGRAAVSSVILAAAVIALFAFHALAAAAPPPPRTGSELPLRPGPWGSDLDPSDAAIGDIDGDSYADLVVCYHATGKVNVALGDGTGSFRGVAEIETETGIDAVAIGRRGGKREALLAVLNPMTERLLLYARSEEGPFARLLPDLPTGKTPVAVAFGYRDAAETEPFVVVVNQGTHDLTVVEPSSGGAFEAHTVDLKNAGQPEPTPTSVAVGDFDGDGRRDDLAIPNRKYETVTILFCAGGGKFERKLKDFRVGTNPADIAAAVVGQGRTPLLAVGNRVGVTTALYIRIKESAFGFRQIGDARTGGGAVSVAMTEVGTMGTALLAVGGRVRGEVEAFLVEPTGGTMSVGRFAADEAIGAVAVGCLSGTDKPFAVAAGRRLYTFPLFTD